MKEFKYSISCLVLLWLQAFSSVSTTTTKQWKYWRPKILAILPQQQSYKDRFLQYNPEFKPPISSTSLPSLLSKPNSSIYYPGMYNYYKVNENGMGNEKTTKVNYLPYTGPKNIYEVAAIPIPTVSEFGEYCDVHRPCNSAKLLECIDSKCYCENSAHRVYDENLKECVILVGSQCSLNTVKNPHVIEPVHPFPYLSVNYVNPRRRHLLSANEAYSYPENPYEPRCIKNSICSWKGNQCECKDGYTETDSKMCQLDIDMPCQANQCNIDRGLGCKQGICQCIDSQDKYVPLTKRCSDMNEVAKRYGAYVGKGAIVYAISRSLDLLQDIPLSLLGFPVG